LDTDLGSLQAIKDLSREFLALDDAFSDRGLQIAHEFGVLSEEEDFLKRQAAGD
jgi:hypothetical protein